MQTQKIKFNDIKGMLSRDEMKEIIGGCGSGSGSDPWASGGGSITLPTVTVYGSYNNSSNYFAIANALSYYGGTNYGNPNAGYYSGPTTSGGGGSTTTTTPQPGPHNLPTAHLPVGNGTNTQVANLCVFRNMEVVEQYFGKTVTQGSFVLQYMQTHIGSNPIMNGFEGTTTDLANFINANFNTTACTNVTSMINAINQDQPILAFLTNSVLPNGTVDGHEVTITGYNPTTSMFTYYNSATDTYSSAPSGAFSSALAVTGARH